MLLTELELDGNGIVDATPLSRLASLVELDLADNNIVDVAPLLPLSSLRALDLMNNRVSDIQPIAANDGLGEGAEVDLSFNPLDTSDTRSHIATLESRGVSVLR